MTQPWRNPRSHRGDYRSTAQHRPTRPARNLRVHGMYSSGGSGRRCGGRISPISYGIPPQATSVTVRQRRHEGSLESLSSGRLEKDAALHSRRLPLRAAVAFKERRRMGIRRAVGFHRRRPGEPETSVRSVESFHPHGQRRLRPTRAAVGFAWRAARATSSRRLRIRYKAGSTPPSHPDGRQPPFAETRPVGTADDPLTLRILRRRIDAVTTNNFGVAKDYDLACAVVKPMCRETRPGVDRGAAHLHRGSSLDMFAREPGDRWMAHRGCNRSWAESRETKLHPRVRARRRRSMGTG